MNIPGYYFDKKKNRYFKITNGSVNHSYHNNQIQKERRHENHDKKSPVKLFNSHKYKMMYKAPSFSSYRLGLVKIDPTHIEFERFKSIQFTRSFPFNEVEFKTWGLINVKGEQLVIGTNQCRDFMVLNVNNMINENGGNMIQKFDDTLQLNHNLNDLINKLNLLPYEYLSVTTFNNLVFYNFISESDLDNPQIYQNFIRLNIVEKFLDKFVNIDKVNVLYLFIFNLPDGEIKKDLYHLFGMNIISLGDERFDYKLPNLKNTKRSFITCSKFIDNFLILGTNLGIVYLIKFNYNIDTKEIQFYQDIIKFKFDRTIKLDKINQIEKFDNYLFLSSFKKLIVVNLNNNQRFIYQMDELIKNFKISKALDYYKIIVVSYRSIVNLVFSINKSTFEIFNKLELFNDNMINQFSIITTNNNVILNQSNDCLFIVKVNNSQSSKIKLNNKDQKINGIMRLNDEYLLMNCRASDNSNCFNVYQI